MSHTAPIASPPAAPPNLDEGWCCIACRCHFDGSMSEDDHLRRCKKAKRLLEQRRQLVARREASGED